MVGCTLRVPSGRSPRIGANSSLLITRAKRSVVKRRGKALIFIYVDPFSAQVRLYRKLRIRAVLLRFAGSSQTVGEYIHRGRRTKSIRYATARRFGRTSAPCQVFPARSVLVHTTPTASLHITGPGVDYFEPLDPSRCFHHL